MINLTINGKKVSVPDEFSVLNAAEKLEIKLPTLCYLKSCGAFASCMVCMVKDLDSGKLIPACSSMVIEGMKLETDSDEVRSARKAALELLLSEHVGDCEAICRVACPAYVNVPEMIRNIKNDDIVAAVKVLQAGVAIPRIIGRICHAPCQKACKRGRHDESVSIRHLEKYIADSNYIAGKNLKPEKSTGQKVAIVGSGPTGLSAAFYLLLLGHQCVVFEKSDNSGGNLRYKVPEKDLPRQVLDEEIEVIKKLGCEFRTKTEVVDITESSGEVAFDSICNNYDAVILASGAESAHFALESREKGLKVNYATFLTSKPGVFAGGDALVPLRQTVRSVADGRAIAQSVNSFLMTGVIILPEKKFDSRSGKNTKEVIAAEVSNANPDKAVTPVKPNNGCTSSEEALNEAKRCLNCDCAKATSCKLRDLATEYEAAQSTYKAEKNIAELITYKKTVAGEIVFEPGKCIKCGICVRICSAVHSSCSNQVTQKYPDEVGMTFIGRGITTRVAVPFNDPLEVGLNKSAEKCIAACPTAALSWKQT